HYAPRARLRLGAARIAPGEAALLFGGARPPGLTDAVGWLDLRATGDLAEAAAGLFAALRFLDAMGTAVIAA
ncbi:Sua5 family C-terminal domain-containing protein, partial [Klebsiella variicola]|uniref:Sua5 family C-terminal domain-containing protein n=1 Tax=Klebsiella variicola TaxID=244366 RepID=UPI0019535779